MNDRMKAMFLYWQLPVLAVAYAAIGWDVRTSPYEHVWLSDTIWLGLYLGAAMVLAWQWIKPSLSASRLAVLLAAGVPIARGLAILVEVGQRIAFWQGLIVWALVARVYSQTRGRGWSATSADS